MAADHRSILRNAAGVPWWGAVAVAVIATAIGIAFDAGSGGKELTTVFAALYVMGCVAAVLIVQQSAVFTTVIQPPLILFFAVPGAYWLFHGATFMGLKAIAINCGYPLIERFPLMLFTTAAVLLIGMVRWYLGMLNHSAASDAEETEARQPSPLISKLSALLTAALNRNPAHAIERPAARPRRERQPGERPRRATPEARRAARQGSASRSRTRSTENGAAPTRSRHIRPPRDEAPGADRPRRRPAPDLRDEPMRRRRSEPGWRDETPRQRTEPAARGNRDPRARSYRPPERPEAPESLPRRRPSTTHHPVSQVRYRKAAGDEPGAQPPGRPRRQHNEEVDSWEYDI